MSLDQTQESLEMLFHVSSREDNGNLSNNTQSLPSPSNISDILQNNVESYKLIEDAANSKMQQLDQSLQFSDIQGQFSSPYFSPQQADSIIGLSHQDEMYDSSNFSSPSSIGMPSLLGYSPATIIQGGHTPESHFSQQHPYLVLQQQSLGSLNNNYYEQQSYFPSFATNFSPVYPYLAQGDTSYTSFWVNGQSQFNGKFESFLPFIHSLYQTYDYNNAINYQTYDYNNTINYQPYSQLLSLQNNYSSMGPILYTTCGESCAGCPNCFSNQLSSSNRVSKNDNNLQLSMQSSQNNYSLKKKSTSTKFPLTSRPIKVSTVFSNRPFKNHDLKRHKRIHLDVKLFPCPSCDKSFSRKDALKRHILVKGCISSYV
ncbi:unnamed protein product [Pneumocystis jirovecii]|uniref:C2H2-type domain-containing protein n=1 Tax=Pneumocystis jirovecii TaxID=42068 RepID=L0PCQ1_PNEJI|nr:unnamed protein product [Pneumocystis jirovecii]